ncbi:BnaCnng36630D [Brassica napus]|uniref:BnaCnng36630D protein n=1 Tax=Brassica napus TaxID=3708 RepID=A0A078J3T9_BRANA|nr:BnaCnng36630D [Brassica napus]
MEAAQIDWNRIDSRFVEDVFYEHLRAPKWFDFLSPNNHLQDSIDDEWFCKPETRGLPPLTPNSSKVCFSFLPSLYFLTPGVTEQNQRIRGHALSEDSENQNPNLATPPPSQQGNQSWRAALKSTSVKKMNKETPKKLKSTQSARNLDILGHISEFCYELKRLATRGVTEREETTVKPQVKEAHDHQVHDLELKKERKPLLEVIKDKDKVHESTDAKGSTIKESRRRKKRVDDAENIPVSLNVEVKMKGEECRRKKKPVVDAENIPPLKLGNVKNKGHERLLQQIRTNPPSPQCFSENRTASLKALMTKSAEKEEKSRDIINKEGGSLRGLDVLWFLKPCTMAN